MPLRGPPDRYGSSARYAASFATRQFGILWIEIRKRSHWSSPNLISGVLDGASPSISMYNDMRFPFIR